MAYKQQPVPFPLLSTALHWEETRAAYFGSKGNHYLGAKQDALLRAAGHRHRIERGED